MRNIYISGSGYEFVLFVQEVCIGGGGRAGGVWAGGERGGGCAAGLRNPAIGEIVQGGRTHQ
jgi:hypothetical protein